MWDFLFMAWWRSVLPPEFSRLFPHAHDGGSGWWVTLGFGVKLTAGLGWSGIFGWGGWKVSPSVGAIFTGGAAPGSSGNHQMEPPVTIE